MYNKPLNVSEGINLSSKYNSAVAKNKANIYLKVIHKSSKIENSFILNK